MQTTLHVQNLRYSYSLESSEVLKNINFSCRKGDFILLAGPSGQGKSTLLKCLNGILGRERSGLMSGTITVNGQTADNLTASELSLLIGSVLQNADEQIIFDCVRDEIAFPLENMNIPLDEFDRRISSAAEWMQLEQTEATRTLSGGQKQRLITAVTLAMQQKVLLFDEPLANLDNKAGKMLVTKCREICDKEGYTIIFAEHRYDLVLPFVDAVFWMQDGTLCRYDSTIEFKKSRQVADAEAFSSPRESCAAQNLEHHQPLIQLTDVEYQAGRKIILSGINFTLCRGDRWVVRGDNGTGKTTLLKLLAALIRPTDGSFSQTVVPHPWQVGLSAWFKRLGYVFQNPNYQLYMPTVRGEFFSRAQSPELAELLLSHFKLDDLRERHPHSLSEGQKRKLGLAAIMAMGPEVLFLDEPTVGQDDKSLCLMLDALHDPHLNLAKTMVTVSHDLRCQGLFGNKVLDLAKN